MEPTQETPDIGQTVTVEGNAANGIVTNSHVGVLMKAKISGDHIDQGWLRDFTQGQFDLRTPLLFQEIEDHLKPAILLDVKCRGREWFIARDEIPGGPYELSRLLMDWPNKNAMVDGHNNRIGFLESQALTPADAVFATEQTQLANDVILYMQNWTGHRMSKSDLINFVNFADDLIIKKQPGVVRDFSYTVNTPSNFDALAKKEGFVVAELKGGDSLRSKLYTKHSDFKIEIIFADFVDGPGLSEKGIPGFIYQYTFFLRKKDGYTQPLIRHHESVTKDYMLMVAGYAHNAPNYVGDELGKKYNFWTESQVVSFSPSFYPSFREYPRYASSPGVENLDIDARLITTAHDIADQSGPIGFFDHSPDEGRWVFEIMRPGRYSDDPKQLAAFVTVGLSNGNSLSDNPFDAYVTAFGPDEQMVAMAASVFSNSLRHFLSQREEHGNAEGRRGRLDYDNEIRQHAERQQGWFQRLLNKPLDLKASEEALKEQYSRKTKQ